MGVTLDSETVEVTDRDTAEIAADALIEVMVDRRGLQSLLDVLHEDGYDVRGPVVQNGTITALPIDGVDQLPTGHTLEQAPGHVTLHPTGESTAFGWASPTLAWKPVVHPPVSTMAVGRRAEGRADSRSHIEMAPVAEPTRRRPLALVGMRPCDAAALERLDTVFLERSAARDVAYERRRREMLIVVVDCARPAPTCFCTSTGVGPHVDEADAGVVDVEITEFDAVTADGGRPIGYLMRAWSERGAAIVAAIPPARRRMADEQDRERRRGQRRASASAQSRRLPAADRLRSACDRLDDQLWERVAERCLACGNCTAVCPTCFCTDVVDVGDLSGDVVERQRRWDTCFSLEFSRVGSSIVRSSVASRYRQWLVHKFDAWHDQFGESGCVGCGRCIAACPVGIDVVAELNALSANGRESS